MRAIQRRAGGWLLAMLASACVPGDRLEVSFAADLLRRLCAAMPACRVSFRPGEPAVKLAAEAAHSGAIWHGPVRADAAPA